MSDSIRIDCPTHKTRLTMLSSEGVLLWCKLCKVQHLFTFAQLEAMRPKDERESVIIPLLHASCA